MTLSLNLVPLLMLMLMAMDTGEVITDLTMDGGMDTGEEKRETLTLMTLSLNLVPLLTLMLMAMDTGEVITDLTMAGGMDTGEEKKRDVDSGDSVSESGP